MYCVYKHTNLQNGKVYIGITSQKPSRRWKSGYGYIEQPYFHRAIAKYGWNGFSHEILEDCLTEEQACAAEQKYIALYHSSDSRFGYNLTNGGIDSAKYTEAYRAKLSKMASARPPVSEETRRKISAASKGRHPCFSPVTRQKLSIALTGRAFTETHKQNISKGKAGKGLNDENANAKAVLCVELNRVFPTRKQAGEFLGMASSNITRCCKSESATCGGYHWKYA